MSALTPQDATNLMFGRYATAIATVLSGGTLAYVPATYYQGSKPTAATPDKPDYSKFFCRISQQTVMEEQRTLSTDCFTPGFKRFGVDGILCVQIFCPKSEARAWELGRAVARIVRDAYRRNVAGDSIVYRRQRILELEPEIECLRLNVIAEYEYDEIG